MTLRGRVVASHGRHVVVEDTQGQRRLCHPRGKHNQAVVGDWVQWQVSDDQGTIEAIEPRQNLFYRQDDVRTKSFAANLDQVLVLVAAEPTFAIQLVARALIAATHAGIPTLIAVNKADLQAPFKTAWDRLSAYRNLGSHMLGLSLLESNEGLADLQTLLQDKTTLVLGPSGVGKSTLINRLVPQAQALTQGISRALNSGKHTTTTTTWYWVDDAKKTALLDSPGFQSFGLHHIAAQDLVRCMPDLASHTQACKFHNCTHVHEPGCGVRQALTEKVLDADRYQRYVEIHAELSSQRAY